MENDGGTGYTPTPGSRGADRATGLESGMGGDFGQTIQGDGRPTQDAKAKVKDAATEAGHRAAERIEERAEVQKTRATSQLGDLARSLRMASDQLPADNGMGRYMGVAASQVDNLAAFLDQNDVADLVDGVEDFARRQPAAFVGGAFAIGMLGARFLKSSRQNVVRDDFDQPGTRYGGSRPDTFGRDDRPGFGAPGNRGVPGVEGPELH